MFFVYFLHFKQYDSILYLCIPFYNYFCETFQEYFREVILSHTLEPFIACGVYIIVWSAMSPFNI